MAASALLVMGSYWAMSTLRWWPDLERWTLETDRPHDITEDAVLGTFGDEGFRRRDVLVASGQWLYEPLAAPLIGRRVTETIAEAGWTIGTDTVSGFRAERDRRVLAVDGGRPGVLRLDDGESARETDRIDTAERWLLESVHGSNAIA